MAQTSGEFLENFTERVIQKHKELHDMSQSKYNCGILTVENFLLSSKI